MKGGLGEIDFTHGYLEVNGIRPPTSDLEQNVESHLPSVFGTLLATPSLDSRVGQSSDWQSPAGLKALTKLVKAIVNRFGRVGSQSQAVLCDDLYPGTVGDWREVGGSPGPRCR
jgi:hypothetical protein